MPEQQLDAGWEAETLIVRTGEQVGTVLYTVEFELLTGADYWAFALPERLQPTSPT
ncbi:hypothetical protein OJ997_36125 [Solirubrobacter phytolaccae]|uniref:Uncharacterized protein n=1 Tax=Solirubrobacter phytolaccae TaxID=1404360 RepID=A0A9X3NFR1_9ACTN|nr:hypothetical protein [Solirubrobacter phytolaccae]MDA0185788.1 hypothetical protein [Solirubrobacter phytolaccae]